MFENLIETKPKKPKTVRGMAISVVVHAVLISGAIYGTLQAKEAIDLLALLRIKTNGNRTDQESHLLEEMLYDLQLRFVNAARSASGR